MSTHAAVGEEFIPQWELGDRLRKVRRLMKMTQVAFARALDVEPETYAAWELGRNKVPDPVSIAKRVKMLSGTPIWWTLDTQESPHPAGPNGGDVATTNNDYSSQDTSRVVIPFPQVTGLESVPVRRAA